VQSVSNSTCHRRPLSKLTLPSAFKADSAVRSYFSCCISSVTPQCSQSPIVPSPALRFTVKPMPQSCLHLQSLPSQPRFSAVSHRQFLRLPSTVMVECAALSKLCSRCPQLVTFSVQSVTDSTFTCPPLYYQADAAAVFTFTIVACQSRFSALCRLPAAVSRHILENIVAVSHLTVVRCKVMQRDL